MAFTVFTNGCFDILHRGHLELLQYCYSRAASMYRGKLVVGLNSDKSVGRLKGKGRPINSQEDRKYFLENLVSCNRIGEVVVFDEDTPRKLIHKIKPDLIVKGGSSVPSKKETGGRELEIFNHIEGYSTTEVLNNLDKLPKGSYEGGHY